MRISDWSSDVCSSDLRLVARRTWLFFETFVRPEDNWLPPDNYQEPPNEETAHRTSPTNIGMMLISSITAWRLGPNGRGSWRASVGQYVAISVVDVTFKKNTTEYTQDTR